MEQSILTTRNYKDTVFSSLFYTCDQAIENARSLYQALTGKKVTNIEKCRLEDVIFREFKNDVAYIMDDKLVCFIEHQSTINPNMPLRFFIYAARTYERKFMSGDLVYTSKLVPIPTPEFYVLYNGTAALSQDILKLSSSFKSTVNNPQLELITKVIDINYDKLKDTDDKALKAYEEIEDLKEKIKNTENSRKSTLTRYNDLQMKLQEMMTAKEKVEMENRSLQNKMKVLQMNEEKNKSGDEAKEELLKLNEELTKEKNEGIKSKERIAQLQKQIDELRAKNNADAPAANDANLQAVIEDKDAEIDGLAAQVAWLHRKLDETSEELDKANEELAQAEQLVEEIDKFEEIKQRKDDEIVNLKAKIEQLLKEQGKDDGDAILDDLDDGIEFTGQDEEEKDQMSLF